jgi:hypothetical protein
MDTVIFSGRISKTEMLHEREHWYNRFVAENRLEDYRVKDEWKKWKHSPFVHLRVLRPRVDFDGNDRVRDDVAVKYSRTDDADG